MIISGIKQYLFFMFGAAAHDSYRRQYTFKSN